MESDGGCCCARVLPRERRDAAGDEGSLRAVARKFLAAPAFPDNIDMDVF